MLLSDFKPRPALAARVTSVLKPRFPVVDAHNHLGEEFGGGWDKRPVAELLDVLDEAGVRMFVDLDGGWGEDILHRHLDHFKAAAPERFQVFGGVNWATWAEQGDGFGEWAAARLRAQAARGAQGLKIWKGFGLNVRDQKGDLVPVDDARLDPVWATAGELKLPVMIHVADPVAFFWPLDGANERWEELQGHLDWHFPSPPFPAFETIMAQLANLVARHPGTTFIGAHVGCYAENLAWVGQLLEKCPNFYVDIAARIAELGRQPYSARRFFLNYADRILFGMDLGADVDWYRLHYRFLETDDEYFNPSLGDVPGQGRWYVYGLFLPDDVLKKVYHQNAQRVLGLDPHQLQRGVLPMQSQADGSYYTFQEIITQPAAWRAMLQDADLQASALRSYWRPEKTQEVICIGCGSTHFLARTAAATFQGMTGVSGRAYPASELLLFPDMVLSNSAGRMLVAISRSGETTETLRAMETFRARDSGPVLGVVCYPDTSLARLTSISLVAREAHEQSVAQTRSFTSMLVAVQALVSIMAGRPFSSGFCELPELGAAIIEEGLNLAQQLGRDAALERFYFLGSGPFYGLACEAMLKMKEMSLSYSEAYHFLEFRHGPMSMVNRQTLVVGLLSEAALPHEIAVLKDMRALGGRVLAVTPAKLPSEAADYQIVLPEGLTDLERGALYLPALQLLAFYRSLRNGLNPDTPTNLTAVVSLNI